MEELPERLDETDRQLQELRERLKVLIERFDRESLDGDRETVDPDDGDSATSPQREAKDVPLLEHLPRKTANPVLAAPDDRERRDSDRSYQPEDRRVPRNRYRYYYYRAPYANLSVYPGFYVPWYSFPSNSPYIYNWPPQRPYYYYRYRGRSFYVRPRPLPYRYGPGNTVVVPPDSEDTYYQ